MAKRLFDLLFSAIGLIVLLPLFVVIVLLIKLDSAGSIFYRARRVGKDGVPFRLYKFRTMIPDADQHGPAITISDDARITPVGRWLRRTKLDELPQLINVLLGQMSLVGPRPEAPSYVALYTGQQRRVLRVRPGITSPAAIAYRHEQQLLSGPEWKKRYVEEIMPAKLALDIEYVQESSLWGDINILWLTVISIWR